MINILQVGMGPLGIKIAQHIHAKRSMKTIAALDINPELKGQSLSSMVENYDGNAKIYSSIDDLDNVADINVIVLSTSSGLKAIAGQIEQLSALGKPIVSTCEELSYPWDTDNDTSTKIDNMAKEKGIAVVATGVNPGFLMDALPTMLTAVSESVDKVEVNRIQDAVTRRVPFQKKIGAGLTLDEFDEKVAAGTLRHVGLTESMHFIAARMGWKLDHTEDVISPIVTDKTIESPAMTINKGDAMGVRQIGRGLVNGDEKIKLTFEAAVGSGVSYDEVVISGSPSITSRIEGGVHGDIATCSIVLNVIPVLMKTNPGLKTMSDLALVSYVG